MAGGGCVVVVLLLLLVEEEFSLDAFVGETLDVQGEGDDDVAAQADYNADKRGPARGLRGRSLFLSVPEHDVDRMEFGLFQGAHGVIKVETGKGSANLLKASFIGRCPIALRRHRHLFHNKT